ncbi:hypothetical protein F2Q68_00011577 [Brassica cretica]|uniref:Uncharacterized protein n=1 Tax=Brassica cretica TaxID=69181 RepID=A0A8S9KWP6_BRACR|nr:hypothetical protein F2Q68_00011577 [Brassica cretica]
MIIDHMLKEVTKSGKGFVQVRVLARDPVYNPPKARREEREGEGFTGGVRGETTAYRGAEERREKPLASFEERNHGGCLSRAKTNQFGCIHAVVFDEMPQRTNKRVG